MKPNISGIKMLRSLLRSNVILNLQRNSSINKRKISFFDVYLKKHEEGKKCEEKADTGKEICVPETTCKSSTPTSDAPSTKEPKPNPCVESVCPPPCDPVPCRVEGPADPCDWPEGVPPPATPLDARIVVIGGGIAGLSAAHRLVTAGFHNTLILEAESRPGGRIRSSRVKDMVVEMGSDRREAEGLSNPLIEMAVQDNLIRWPLSKSDPSKGLFKESNGQELPMPILYKSYLGVKEIIREYKDLMSKAGPKGRGELEDYIGVRAQQELRRFPAGPMAMTAARAVVGLVSAFRHELGDDKDCVTSDALGSYVRMNGAEIQIPLGYVGELGPLLNSVGGKRVKYKKQVQIVRWGTVVSRDEPRAIVKCSDGSEYPAHYVIVTCSLGVLKSMGNTMFSPSLPATKMEAIKCITFEHVNKAYFEYDKPLWSWREDPISFSWGNTDLGGRSGWLSGLRKLQEISGSDYILAATIMGKEASLNLEQKSTNDISEGITNFLKEYLGDKDIPKPCNVYRSMWSGNKHFLGAYSRFNMGSEEKNLAALHELSSPLPLTGDTYPPIIYFAGEATCAELHGTVQGAKLSGIREAERLIQIIKSIPHKEESVHMRHSKDMVAVAC